MRDLIRIGVVGCVVMAAVLGWALGGHTGAAVGVAIGLLIGVILILGGLQFFPALALGPIVEHFHILGGAS